MILTLVARAKQRVEHTVHAFVRKTALVAAAAIVLLFAAAFGLVATYFALIEPGGFRPLEAAGIVGACLLALGLLVLAALPLANVGRREDASAIAGPAKVARLVDKGASAATRQVGALPLVMIAFAAGFLVTKR